MSRVRVCCYSISLDGYGAGPDQSVEHPLGKGGERLHDWQFHTRTFQQKVMGRDGGDAGPDDEFVRRGFENVGAWILGRNMFAPSRGPWPDDGWKGWWGDEPPYHVPAFILTHYPRPSIEMQGGTVFHFVTDPREAMQRAKEAAGGKDVRIGGGAMTIREYLAARQIDELHIAVAPVLLGRGEPLFRGVDLKVLGYRCVQHVATEHATHYRLAL